VPTVRDLRDDDHRAVARVAAVCDEVGAVSGSDSRYLSHVASRGRVAVSEVDGEVVAYAGAIHVAGAAFLTDLFVQPGSRGAGHGQALLAHVWADAHERVTSASRDPRALGVYARYGAVPRWPLVYLEIGGGGALPQLPVLHRETLEGDVQWHLALDGLATARVLGGPEHPVTTAVVRRDGSTWTVLRAETPDPRGLVVLLADLRMRAGSEGLVRLAVPGPHPGLPDLLRAGARVVDVDLWCSSAGAADLVDPVRVLPSAALG
jgi:GNAT superfamily N-acetyltransferase